MTTDLFARIEGAIDYIYDGWTSYKQGRQIAEAILNIKPQLSVEIGVFAGKGIVSMGLAHKEIGIGRVVGIDPWSQAASADGQDAVNASWWGTLDHEAIYQKCVNNLSKYDLNDIVTLIRQRSDDVTPPAGIGFIRIDGNHGPAAFRDVKRFCPQVVSGGILHLDDINWQNGSGQHGADDFLKNTGWKEIDRIDTGAVYQKT